MKNIQQETMENRNLEQVKALINEMDDCKREGPPTKEQIMRMQTLTGVDWTAEELGQYTFEYESRASLEETAYLMFHQKYPPIHETELVFWKCREDTPLDDKAIYETYQFGRGTLEALEALPYDAILLTIRKSFPGWEQSESSDTGDARFNSPEQRNYWSDTHFWMFEYGRETEIQREHQLLVFHCHNMSEEQIALILACMEQFQCPLHLRDEQNLCNKG